MNKSIQRGLVAVGVLATVGAANAAIDTTAAMAGVADAQAAVTVVIGGMITMAIAVFGLKKMWSLFRGN
jgi:hypothetical protein